MAGKIAAQVKAIRPVWVTFGRFHGVTYPGLSTYIGSHKQPPRNRGKAPTRTPSDGVDDGPD